MSERAPPHPLDQEEVRVTLSLTHTPTNTTVVDTAVAPCDTDPSVSDVIDQLADRLKDELYGQLESH